MRFAVFLALLVSVPALAQTPEASGETGSIVGVVTDAETGETLPGANVVVVGTELGVATDIDGRFVISEVPRGTFSLDVMFAGFEIARIDSVVVSPGELVNVDVPLKAGNPACWSFCHCWNPVRPKSPFASRIWYYSDWEPELCHCNCGTISLRDMPLAR